MIALTRALNIRRFVLFWFLISIAANLAHAISWPSRLERVCSPVHGIKVIAVDEQNQKRFEKFSGECPLCMGPSVDIVLYRSDLKNRVASPKRLNQQALRPLRPRPPRRFPPEVRRSSTSGSGLSPTSVHRIVDYKATVLHCALHRPPA